MVNIARHFYPERDIPISPGTRGLAEKGDIGGIRHVTY
jgi:hypothetical protein